MMQNSSSYSVWQAELLNLLRGASGGFLFGLPLLYTVEVWWIGSSTTPAWMLLALGITFFVIYLLNQSEGFRSSLDIQLIDALMETVEAMAIGIICALIALILLCRITFDTPLNEALGKLVFECIPFSIGVALARSSLRGDRVPRTVKKARRLPQNSIFKALLADIDATLIGSLIVAFSISPTEEVSLLSASISPLWLLLIILASLVISYCIVFVAGLTNQTERRQQKGLLQRPINETLICYLVCLLASALMLWFFQQLSWDDPWQEWLSDTLILGLPATIGGAAGRLVI